MRHRLILAFVLTLIVLIIPAATVRRSAALTGPAVTVYCYNIGFGRAECHADVIGGTSPYTYQWTPTPIAGGGEIVIMSCPGTSVRTFSATVTDSLGSIGSDSLQHWCSPNCEPYCQ